MRCGTDHPPTFSAQVKERVQLYLYYYGPSQPVLRWTLLFTHSVTINLSVIFKLLFPHITHVLFITVDWLVLFHLYRRIMKLTNRKGFRISLTILLTLVRNVFIPLPQFKCLMYPAVHVAFSIKQWGAEPPGFLTFSFSLFLIISVPCCDIWTIWCKHFKWLIGLQFIFQFGKWAYHFFQFFSRILKWQTIIFFHQAFLSALYSIPSHIGLTSPKVFTMWSLSLTKWSITLVMVTGSRSCTVW